MKAPPTIGQRDPPKVHESDDNGTKALIRSRRYRNWGARVARAKGGYCQLCWERDQRIVPYDHKHHIVPRSDAPELAMNADNIMLLCESHHEEMHAQERRDSTGGVKF